IRRGPFSDLNSGLVRIFVNVQVTSPAPPAVGLSPISLIIKGVLSLVIALSRLSFNEAVGAINSNWFLTSQKLWANASAVELTFAWSSPVTITTAWLRGSSAQA